MKRKIFLLLLAMTCCFGLFSMAVAAVDVNDLTAANLLGEFENFKFYFDPETGTIIVVGVGPMPEFPEGEAPWAAYAHLIKRIVISEGVTAISKNAFKKVLNTIN